MNGLLFKRIFDLAAVVITAPLWLPLVAILALLIRVKLGSPVFFRQKRPGHREAIFELIKFRSYDRCPGRQGRPPAGRHPPHAFRQMAAGHLAR
jgi:lipopolysaccharide/colanic/teichoic acid biosynthesis glycosyltransferase